VTRVKLTNVRETTAAGLGLKRKCFSGDVQDARRGPSDQGELFRAEPSTGLGVATLEARNYCRADASRD
jgi:hypothetical protein